MIRDRPEDLTAPGRLALINEVTTALQSALAAGETALASPTLLSTIRRMVAVHVGRMHRLPRVKPAAIAAARAGDADPFGRLLTHRGLTSLRLRPALIAGVGGALVNLLQHAPSTQTITAVVRGSLRSLRAAVADLLTSPAPIPRCAQELRRCRRRSTARLASSAQLRTSMYRFPSRRRTRSS